MRFLKRILLVLAGGWLVLCGLVYLFQRKLQYFPDSSQVPLPGGTGIEDVRLTTADGVELRAWYWPGKRDTVLLIFHGNAGHRGHRLDWIRGFHSRGWGVLLPDYRGYGGSGGSPTEEGLYADADASVEFLSSRGVKSIVYFGKSLGSGVALDLAARRRPAALIIQAGAVSMADVARNAYPFLPIGLLMKDRFDSTEKLMRIDCPLLSIHGSADRTVPARMGRALYEAFPGEEKEWYEVAGARHNDTSYVGGRAYYEKISGWLEAALRTR